MLSKLRRVRLSSLIEEAFVAIVGAFAWVLSFFYVVAFQPWRTLRTRRVMAAALSGLT